MNPIITPGSVSFRKPDAPACVAHQNHVFGPNQASSKMITRYAASSSFVGTVATMLQRASSDDVASMRPHWAYAHYSSAPRRITCSASHAAPSGAPGRTTAISGWGRCLSRQTGTYQFLIIGDDHAESLAFHRHHLIGVVPLMVK